MTILPLAYLPSVSYFTCLLHDECVVEVKAAAGNLRDSVTILVGNVLKPKRMQAPRRTTGPQTTN